MRSAGPRASTPPLEFLLVLKPLVALALRSDAAARARLADRAEIIARLHEPCPADAQRTGSRASQSAAVSARTPPVGQNRTLPKGPESAFSAGIPPEASAGKNLKRSSPRSSPRMMSAAVATPGRNGMPVSRAASARGWVRPGETMNSAAGVDRLRKLRFVEHCPCAGDRARYFRHLADCVERDRRSKCDLEHWKSRRDERLGERGPVHLLLEDEHRDDRCGSHDLVDVHGCSLAKAAAAPNRPGSG